MPVLASSFCCGIRLKWMVFCVTCSRKEFRVHTVTFNKGPDHACGPGCGEFPVRSKTRIVDRHIVSMSFNAYMELNWLQHSSYPLQRSGRSLFQHIRSLVIEPNFVQADNQSIWPIAQFSFFLLDFLCKRR